METAGTWKAKAGNWKDPTLQKNYAKVEPLHSREQIVTCMKLQLLPEVSSAKPAPGLQELHDFCLSPRFCLIQGWSAWAPQSTSHRKISTTAVFWFRLYIIDIASLRPNYKPGANFQNVLLQIKSISWKICFRGRPQLLFALLHSNVSTELQELQKNHILLKSIWSFVVRLMSRLGPWRFGFGCDTQKLQQTNAIW